MVPVFHFFSQNITSIFILLLPFLKNVSNDIIREFNEYLYFYLLNMHLERFAGLENLTDSIYPPDTNSTFSEHKERLSNLLTV